MRKIIHLCWLVIILYACQKPTNDSLPNPSSQDDNFITLNKAQKIAQIQAPMNSKGGKSSQIQKKVKSTFSVKPDNDNPSMYIINYEEGGFAIISADNRLMPILAYSDDNSFPTDQKILPSGLVDWLSSVHETVKSVRKQNLKQDSKAKLLWNQFSKKTIANTKSHTKSYSTVTVGDCNNGDSGYYFITTSSILTNTLWNQGAGFNDLLPHQNCSSTGNGRVWAGCVPVAFAQIMRYHQFPNSYNWSAMPNDNFGSAEISRLIRDLALPNNLDTQFGCDASATSSNNSIRAFQNFGYPTPSYSNYNFFTVMAEIQLDRPVLLSGGSNGGWWIFGKYVDGHMWVCDGFNTYSFYNCVPDPNTPGEWISTYSTYSASLHMNWGWGGAFNAWYASDNFTLSSGQSFNYQRKMITGIRKP